MRVSTLIIASGCVTALACDSGSKKTSGAPPDSDPGTPPDSGSSSADPPTVVSISPPDQAIGVTSDATIVITFSTEMDRAATQAAFQSPDLPPCSSVLTWNAAGTVLTVTPNQPLAYATGSDPGSVTAKRYSILVSTAAVDLSGHHLASTYASSFRTKRKIQQVIATEVVDLTGSVVSDGGVLGDGFDLGVGDTFHDGVAKGVITFDITALPSGVHLESATLKLFLEDVLNAPIPALGPLIVDHVTFAHRLDAFDAVARLSFGSMPISRNDDSGFKTIDVLAGVVDDLANRDSLGNLSQYRLATTVPTDHNGSPAGYSFADAVAFSNSPELDVEYSID